MINITPKETEFLTTQLKNAGLQANGKKIKATFKSNFRIVTLKDEKTPFIVDIMLLDKQLGKRKR
ncbi:hypothetical protein HXY32_00905 [Candidatus Bathyarchaeota archaeon]|nr:hypothetical protein [Candidatus Bathyarchaeota archaeon]